MGWFKNSSKNIINFNPKDICIDQQKILMEYRRIYSEKLYPLKLGQNIAYGLYPLNELWNGGVDNFFEKKFSSHEVALEHVVNLYSSIASQTVLPKFSYLWENNITAGDIQLSLLKIDIDLAMKGHNDKVEHLEYTFLFYYYVKSLFNTWLSLGMIGYKKEEAVNKVSEVVMAPIKNINFENVMVNFRAVASLLIPMHYKALNKFW